MRKSFGAKYLLWLTVMALMFAFSSMGSATAFARGSKHLPGAASGNQNLPDAVITAKRADGAALVILHPFISAPSFDPAPANNGIIAARMFETFRYLLAPRQLFAPRAPPSYSI